MIETTTQALPNGMTRMWVMRPDKTYNMTEFPTSKKELKRRGAYTPTTPALWDLGEKELTSGYSTRKENPNYSGTGGRREHINKQYNLGASA